jgi:hypothetical protein
MKRVIVHIDRLVLKGFQHEDRHAVAAGLQQELAKLLAEPASAERLAGLGSVSRLRVGKAQIQQGAKPQRMGIEAARSIAQGIRP